MTLSIVEFDSSLAINPALDYLRGATRIISFGKAFSSNTIPQKGIKGTKPKAPQSSSERGLESMKSFYEELNGGGNSGSYCFI